MIRSTEPGRRCRRATAAVALLLCALLPASAQNTPWQRALPGYRYEFPRDHFNHPDYQTEWWYYTGNLKTAAGRRFGFELTFFRQGVARPEAAETTPPVAGAAAKSPWELDDVYLAHLALSDLEGARFYHRQRVNRAGPGLAGADLVARRVWNGNWQVQFENASEGTEPAQDLRAVCDEFSLQLTLRPAKPPVIHGVNGVSQKGPERGQASHYISYTRLAAQGALTLAGQKINLSGLAWMDHEFFTQQLAPELEGWDWFSVQLANGEELMLYRLRRRDGSPDPYSAGTYVDSRGVSRHLAASEFSLEPGAAWRSPATGARYPVHWTLRVPALELALEATTRLENQEFAPQPGDTARVWSLPTYWEGAIELMGAQRGAPISGVGYLEMTEYDRPVHFGAQ